ncbi:MAG: ferredoxin--NADP reductase [Chitinophagaceae bacterium]
MNNLEYHNCRIIDIITVTPYIRRFFIQYDVPMPYQSGQFVIIEFGSLNHQFSTRSYSIADRTDGDTIELCVVLKEDGAATPLLFNQQIGDVLKVSNPQGRFVLPEPCPDSISYGFICTGTGVAPFRAMIKDMLIEKHVSSPIYLYFGCRIQDDILYRDEFEQLSNQFPNFHYIPVLSRESWDGAMGYVHSHYDKVFATKPEALIYLCGWTEMIKQTRDQLKSYGYSRNEIKVEFYD